MIILGISCYYHDSAAAIIRDGVLVAAAQEERFTRRKHDSSFPRHAVQYCLSESSTELRDIDIVVYYENPSKKVSRIASTILTNLPHSANLFLTFSHEWICGKYAVRHRIHRELQELSRGKLKYELHFVDHHLSHAASAFYLSPYRKAAILIADGVGEWATTSLGYGENSNITLDHSIAFPNSIGLLYSTFTAFLGFKVNSGEYKVMGLAPYGAPTYVRLILDNLLQLSDDGSFLLNMNYFTFPCREVMFNEKLAELLGIPPRVTDSSLTKAHLDIARSIQDVVNHLMLRLAETSRKRYKSQNLCMAGGVALNCVTNSKLLAESGFDNVWIQPAAGDAGGALGAAVHISKKLNIETTSDNFGLIDSSYRLGPSFSNAEIERELHFLGANFSKLDDLMLLEVTVDAIESGQAIGWFQERMEFGPRALGARSILADPRLPSMQQALNKKIKFRESFRPFAPAILEEHVSDWYDWEGPSPYMLFVATLKQSKRSGQSFVSPFFGNEIETTVPAVTHVDYTSRIQTVSKARNSRFYELVLRFYKRTGCPMLLNTSFNIRGEPIVCSPRDAYRCFMGTDLDLLVIGNCVLRKDQQNPLALAHYRDAVPLD
jgi:carbamoyltransferase